MDRNGIMIIFILVCVLNLIGVCSENSRISYRWTRWLYRLGFRGHVWAMGKCRLQFKTICCVHQTAYVFFSQYFTNIYIFYRWLHLIRLLHWSMERRRNCRFQSKSSPWITIAGFFAGISIWCLSSMWFHSLRWAWKESGIRGGQILCLIMFINMRIQVIVLEANSCCDYLIVHENYVGSNIISK